MSTFCYEAKAVYFVFYFLYSIVNYIGSLMQSIAENRPRPQSNKSHYSEVEYRYSIATTPACIGADTKAVTLQMLPLSIFIEILKYR